MEIGLLLYGRAGNIGSIKNALDAIGCTLNISTNVADLKSARALILPGVGAYHSAMAALEPQRKELLELVNSRPVLGICLGMQILGHIGFEDGVTRGLELIEGQASLLNSESPTPHLGWKSLEYLKTSPIFNGIAEDARFYFMHSYKLITYRSVTALASYGGESFVAAIADRSLFGVQFHPEKSGKAGLALLKNFVSLAR